RGYGCFSGNGGTGMQSAKKMCEYGRLAAGPNFVVTRFLALLTSISADAWPFLKTIAITAGKYISWYILLCIS
ncbi:MAG: hypothetical protein OXC82_04200, partial [Rhodobacteraceae bacterium]|nr:hypothetical protein [Paracoccaceae bacterium]MCY4249623.1 hypothetical protein [Paracoccaceae bacterium]